MTHTPGPWTAHHHESTDTYTICVAGRSWESWAVAHVGDCTQDAANARLIASAPALLAALEACVCAMQDYQAGIGITEMFDKGERMGRAAIARATG